MVGSTEVKSCVHTVVVVASLLDAHILDLRTPVTFHPQLVQQTSKKYFFYLADKATYSACNIQTLLRFGFILMSRLNESRG